MAQYMYDIFISYKRKSLPTANNLYYRLTSRGFSTFFDLEEMRRDNFNTQLLTCIENAKDVFVILEEGSLDACKSKDWENDWFCYEIAFALEKNKNIIPILIGGYKMPSKDFLPNKLQDLRLKNAPEFNFSFFEAYIDKLIEKDFLISKPDLNSKATSVFKFYSNESCQVFKEGKLVCNLTGMSDEPYYLPIHRKGDYRFKGINAVTSKTIVIKEHIDANEEKDIEIIWELEKQLHKEQTPDKQPEDTHSTIQTFNVAGIEFRMVKITKGSFYMGSIIPKTNNLQMTITDIPNSHTVVISNDFYIGETAVTQELWSSVMQYNPSRFIDNNAPVDSISWDQCQSFIKRLNQMTGMKFRLPTEAEWEYAARGGNKSKNYLYSGSNVLCDVAWCLDNSNSQTHPVKQKNPNELGLYDMSGNVWEWCQDFYNEYVNGIQHDPIGPSYGTKRVYKGGCWCEIEDCRTTMRRAGSQDFYSYGGLGLRLALSL
ncbi:MAG: TIR domain-containing protein [Bacteroidales bacterium]|nr:TIR domain-containing protein [Bacteroidales bacterium]